MHKLLEIGIVFGGGALGGVVSVMEAWADPTVWPLSVAKFFALFMIPFVKGGVAAGIGVYVLTTLDQSHMARAFFFSVACGLTFPSILAKGGSMVDSVTAQVAQQTIRDNVSSILAASSSAKQGADVKVAEIKTASERIIEAGSKLPEGDKRQAESAVQTAIAVLGRKARTGDTTSVEAITDIAERSITVKLHQSVRAAIKELEALQTEPNLPEDIRKRAAGAVAAVRGLQG
jgi:hypothetical protein